MDSYALHWSFRGEHVLIPMIRLQSLPDFLEASLLSVIICLLERYLSFLLKNHSTPRLIRRTQWKNVVWRCMLYWLANFMRLCYMLIAMSFHLGLLLVIASTLTIAQFVIELLNASEFRQQYSHSKSALEPLLHEPEVPQTFSSVATRPRSKSKPEAIFIHPTQSNLARADAVALELGISGNTDRVFGNRYLREEAAWEVGKGRDAARILLGSRRQDNDPQQYPFQVSDSSDNGSEDT